MSDLLSDAQTVLQTRFRAQDYFSGITILTQDEGDIENKIARALAALGVSVILLMADADDIEVNLPHPYFNNVALIAQIAENVAINRANAGYKTALQLAQAVTFYAHHHNAADDNNEVFIAESIRLVDPPAGATVCYHVRIKTSGGIDIT